MFNGKKGAILALIMIVLLAFVPGVVQAAAETPPTNTDVNQMLLLGGFVTVIVVAGIVLYVNIRLKGFAAGVESAVRTLNSNVKLLDDAEAILKYVPADEVRKITSALDTAALYTNDGAAKAAIAQVKKFIIAVTDGLPNEPSTQ